MQLIQARMDQLAGMQTRDGRSTPVDQSAYRRARRLTSWDAWAQAAMAAEDLEIMLTSLLQWRADGGDLLARCRAVVASGPSFFEDRTEAWAARLPRILRVPSATDLQPTLNRAEADLLATGLSNSVREAIDDLYAVVSMIPWDVRLALMPYKHGFRWIIPSIAPIPTDRAGRESLSSAPDTAFVVDIDWRSGMIFTASDDEIEAALVAAQFSVALETFVVTVVVSEAESRHGAWGVGLYGDSASDAAQQALLARARHDMRRH